MVAPGQRRILEANTILHLPQALPEAEFGGYGGHWIRCIYQPTDQRQQTYSTSPRIVGLALQAIGGTVDASQCIRVQEELLGVSTGKAGQTFQLQMQPVLERQPDQEHLEYIEIRTPGEPPEVWQEVTDFASSGASDRHYTIDSRTGTVQFGPVIRTATHLKDAIQLRSRLQAQIQPRSGYNSAVMVELAPMLPCRSPTNALRTAQSDSTAKCRPQMLRFG